MTRQDFDELNLADAQIEDIHIKPGEVVVRYCDWQEQQRVLRFVDVSATQVLSSFSDLSHGDVAVDDPLLALTQQLEPTTTNMYCLRLFSAMEDAPIVRIVATSFRDEADGEPQKHTS